MTQTRIEKSQVLEVKEQYVSEFEKLAGDPEGNGAGSLAELRKRAMDRFETLGFPEPKNENWRHTSLKALTEITFKGAAEAPVTEELSRRIAALEIEGLDAARLVFIDGRYCEKLSNVGTVAKGITITTLRKALDGDAEEARNHFAHYAKFEDAALVALNTAFFDDGAYVELAAGKTLDRPVRILNVITGKAEAEMVHPRNLIVIGEGAEAEVIESYVGLGDATSFTNAVTEIVVGANGGLTHIKICSEGSGTFHLATVQSYLGRDCRFASNTFTFGGRLVRNDINVYLDGEGIDCRVDGLYLAEGTQKIDTHTRLDHAKPHCNSFELFKGILKDEATAIFNGKIMVHQIAQKTNAKQSNKNLLLSERATVHTQPQLEIFADDVRCTHGSTVGQLDGEAIFYLSTRGIDKETARAMLIDGFAGEIVDRVKNEALRGSISRTVFERFHPDGAEV